MMHEHRPFSYRNADELRADAARMGLTLPWSEDLSALFGAVRLGNKTAPTRFAALPVEGRDSEPDGSPSELTFRRYRRYAEGGSGLIHFEAVAVSPEGRGSDYQLMIDERTLPRLGRLLEETRATARKSLGHTPLCYIQLQESGRYVHATGMTPRIVARVPEFDRRAHVADEALLLTDAELDRTLERFVDAAVMAYKIGFDGADVKACHRYLMSELLAAHTREGRYGGSYENRVRLFLEVVDRIRAAIPDPNFHIISRFNLYDAIAWPWGWGVAQKEGTDPFLPEPDMTEPLKLLARMKEKGLVYISTTCGTPYGRAWVNRPFDRLIPGSPQPPEHPLEGVCRGIALTAQAQRACPDLAMAGFGYSWLRQFIPNVAAGILAEGGAAFVGLGRELFAYPDMPRDILEKRGVDKNRVCVTCSWCSEVMAKGGIAGCYVRDREGYGELFRAHREGRSQRQVRS